MGVEDVHTCIICHRDQQHGIVICSQFICDECEREMVRTEVEEEKYNDFVTGLRRIWFRKSS